MVKTLWLLKLKHDCCSPRKHCERPALSAAVLDNWPAGVLLQDLAAKNTLFVMDRTGGRESRLFPARQKCWINSKGHQEGPSVYIATLKIILGILYLVSHAIESECLGSNPGLLGHSHVCVSQVSPCTRPAFSCVRLGKRVLATLSC